MSTLFFKLKWNVMDKWKSTFSNKKLIFGQAFFKTDHCATVPRSRPPLSSLAGLGGCTDVRSSIRKPAWLYFGGLLPYVVVCEVKPGFAGAQWAIFLNIVQKILGLIHLLNQ